MHVGIYQRERWGMYDDTQTFKFKELVLMLAHLGLKVWVRHILSEPRIRLLAAL